jgi:PAS domain S-box-containing protein
MQIANLSQKLPSLGSIVDRQPLTVAPELPLVDVISFMSQAQGHTCRLSSSKSNSSNQALEISAAARHSSVLVLANNRLVGIFTERDLVKLTASQTDLQSVAVGAVMTTDPISLILSEQHTVMTALAMFQQHQIRHLPILDDFQQLIGIVTPEHIRQVLQPINLLKFKSVAEAMTSDVIHALPTTTVLEIAQMMSERNIGSIVIVDDSAQGKPVGIITERDIVQFQAFELDLAQLLAQELMSSTLFCLQPTDSLWAAQQIMQTKNIRRLVITNNRGELVGILTQSNLLQLLDPLEMLSMVDSLQSQLIDRATELEQSNRELQAEVTRREQVETQLHRAAQTLEERVVVRTLELAKLTEELQIQVAEQQSCNISLEASQQGISDFIENALIGMHWVDVEGNIVWVNQAELNMYGYDRSEYIGQPLINFHVDRTKIADILQRVSHNESMKNCEAQVYRKDGSICDVSIDVHAFFKDDKFIHARCFTRDITSRKQAEASVRQSELKFRAIFDGTFQFVGLLDTDGIVLEANRTALDAIAATSEDVVGQPFWATPWWTHSPDLQRQLQQGIEQAAQGELVRFEAKHFLADGSYIIVDFSLSPIFDETGKVVMLIPEGRDITDRKQIETELQESRSRYRALVTSAPVGIFQTDAAGNSLFVNQRCLELMGVTLAEALGEGWANTLHPDDRASVYHYWHIAVQAQQEFTSEHRFLTPQGQVNWVFVKAIGIYDESGTVTGYIGTMMDTTEQQAALRERKAAAQKIQEQAALLDIATDAIIVRDLDSQIQFWNNGAESIYGWSAAEAVGRKITQLLSAETSTEVAIADRTVRQQGVWQGELHKRTKTGREVIVESRWTLVRDEVGTPTSILSVDTDITEKKSLEQQFLRAQRLESLGSLASGIAHDLNNVLTPIVGAAQLLPLTLPNLDARNQRLLKMLVESSKRGSGLVKQILTFARGTDGERMVLQVRHILAEIISVARQTFPKSIEIILNLDSEDLWLVSVDATQIHQVFMNLFVNARDAMSNGGSLMASAENIIIDADRSLSLQLPVGSYILITVADTGIGMTSEMLDRIFDPFFTTKETGTGLGLSTVQGIVKAHGGSIEVESEVGRGSCFKIYLPAIDRHETESPAATENLHDGKGQLVLVVDDETAIREITKVSLETYNYRVMLASDGIEAIDIYAQNHRSIAIVLVDTIMPNLDTPSIILALQQINPQVRVVVMSGSYLNLEAIVNRQEVGAYLNKPFTTAEMLETLANIRLE